MTRRAVARAGVLAATALLAVACGSDGSGEESQLPSDLAEDLAGQSDAVQTTLEEGDGCGAKDQAIALRDDVKSAIAEGRVPSELRPELRRRANDLVASIHCDPPAPRPPPPPPPSPAQSEEEDD